MTEMLDRTHARSDAELISDVRSGNLDAYGELFSRHADAARRLARQFARGSDAEDLVSDAFTKVMGVLADGGGPDIAFRAYLLTTIRRLHVDRVRKEARITNYDDMRAFDEGAPFSDSVVAEFESGAAARAFASLPVRWQVVLWHLEVEKQKPADIAPLLGMSRNSVCALAYRAREGLRQAFLGEHLRDTGDAECRWTVEHLGAYVRTGLARRETTKVKAHLETCRSCTAMNLELTEVNSNLRGVIAPLLLGTAAAGYLAGAGSGVGIAGFMVLLGRARDSLFGSSGASAGTAPGVTAGTSAGAVGGTAVATTAGSSAATMAATAAGTTAGTAAATTAAAATAAGVATGGAMAGMAAGTTAGVLGAVAAGAATSAAGVGAASIAMIAIGTVATTLGVDPSPQYVDVAAPMSVTSAITSAPPVLSAGVSSPETVPEQVEPAPPPGPAPSDGASSVTPPVASSDSTVPSGEVCQPSESSTSPGPDTAPVSEPDQPSGSATSPAPDTAPVTEPTQESNADEDPTEEVPPTSGPDPSPTLSDSPEAPYTTPSDSESTPPDGSPSFPVEPTPVSSPSSPAPLPELDEQPVEPSEGQTQ